MPPRRSGTAISPPPPAAGRRRWEMMPPQHRRPKDSGGQDEARGAEKKAFSLLFLPCLDVPLHSTFPRGRAERLDAVTVMLETRNTPGRDFLLRANRGDANHHDIIDVTRTTRRRPTEISPTTVARTSRLVSHLDSTSHSPRRTAGRTTYQVDSSYLVRVRRCVFSYR